MRYDWTNPHGNKLNPTTEQLKFVEDAKERIIQKRKQQAREDFLENNKLITITSKKQAIKVLKELNKKCGSCSKLLNESELTLKCKLENTIQKEDSKLMENLK